jgi:uncharacterized protein YbjT (DUF2867 family)
MNILVITPDGDFGCRVVAELLSPEFTLRVITDDPVDLPGEWREQVEVIDTAAHDAGTLRQALAGVGSVLWCLPSGTDLEPLARALSEAMREAGTPRLVTVSASDCELTRNPVIISGQPAIESILNKSGAAIRHLRRNLSMEKAGFQQKERMFSLPIPGGILAPLMVADDAVNVALRWLVRRDWEGVEELVVSGPKQVLL